MEGLVPILIYVVLGLIALGLLVIVVAGVLSLVRGKVKVSTLAALAVPVVVFAIAWAVSGTPVEAVITTVLVLLGIGILAVLLSGLKGLVGF